MRSRGLVVLAVGLLLFVQACSSGSKDNGVKPDTTAPSAIADLILVALTDSSGIVSWTAPGDDGDVGTATAYDLRMATENITDATWDDAFQVSGEPTPQPAGTTETMEVTGDPEESLLSILAAADTSTFYLSMRSVDESENWSELSNILIVEVIEDGDEDEDAPAAISDLALLSQTDSTATISWTAPGDDGSEGTADSYDARLSNELITHANWHEAVPVEGEPTPKVAGSSETMEIILDSGSSWLSTLAEDETFYIAIRTKDESGNESDLSNVLSVVQGETADVFAPSAIVNLSVTSQTDTSAFISWTAPGDDGNTGTAWSYDVRVHSESITGANWDDATQIGGEPSPQVAGSTEAMEVIVYEGPSLLSGLAADETFYLAIRTRDEAMNTSSLSNIVSVVIDVPTIISIPDANLLAELRLALSIPSGAISAEDMLTLGPVFDARNKGISNLTGMEYALNLTGLDLAENSIPTLGSLSGLTTLESLELEENLFNDIEPLKDMVNLTSLNIRGNFVSNATHLSGLTKLTELFLGDNTITDIASLSTLVDLETLEVYENNVADISVASGLSDLSFLNLADTQVADLSPLASNTEFATGDEVKLFNCPLTEESLDTHIATLEGRGATVTLGGDIWPPAAVDDLAISDITDTSMTLTWTSPGGSSRTSATSYDVRYSTGSITEGNWGSVTPAIGEPTPSAYGQLESVTIEFPASAPMVRVSPEEILQVSYYVALKSKDGSNNESALSNVVTGELLDVTPPGKINNLDLVSFTETSVTVQWYSPGDDDFSGDPAAFEVRYSTEEIIEGNWASATIAPNPPAPQGSGHLETLEVTGLTAGTRYYIAIKTRDEANNWSELSNVVSAVPLAITVVTFPDAALEAEVRSDLGIPTGDITTVDMAELTSLYAPNVGILDLTGLESASNLDELRLARNSISNLSPLANLTALDYLDLYQNNVTDVSPLAGLTNLTFLNLSLNSITDVSSLSGLTKLQSLYMYSTGISDPNGIQSMTVLRNLDLSGNPVSDLMPVSGLFALESLYVSSSNVSNVGPLSALTALKYLYLSDCNISDISALAGMVNMLNITLSRNSLTDISALSGMTQLVDLSATDNNISDLSPLSGITSMQVLWLYNNNISDISSLSGMINMEQMSLFGNNISDISAISGMTKVRRLFISSNPYSSISALSTLIDLEELTISSTSVSDLSPLSGLSTLFELSIGQTLVSDLSPLAGITSLKELSCWFVATIVDISALQGLINLETVYLNSTGVIDLLPLVNNASFATDDFLNVEDCPLSVTSTGTHIPTLEARGVTVVQ